VRAVRSRASSLHVLHGPAGQQWTRKNLNTNLFTCESSHENPSILQLAYFLSPISNTTYYHIGLKQRHLFFFHRPTMPSAQSSYDPESLLEILLEDTSVINKIICEIGNPDDNSTFLFTKDGLRLVINGDRTSQVSAFFSTSTFDEFMFNADDCIRYKFSLKDFIETLNILREEASDENLLPSPTSLKMSYRRRGDPLRLKLDNRSSHTAESCLREFSTPSIQPLMSFNDLEETAEIYFYSKELYKYISGLDLATSAFLEIFLKAGRPVRMLTESPTMGDVELEIKSNRDRTELNQPIIMRDLIIPDNIEFRFNYRCKFIAPALDALKSSSHVRMKCGQSGLLLMEHFHSQDARVQSVQYFVLSEVVVA
jgi:hypothetical protein